MKQLTVRDVEDELHTALKREAQHRGTSVNRCVLALLRQSVGLDKQEAEANRTYDDLDHLAGTWSEEEAAAFERHLKDQRRIDEELWR